MPIVFQLRFEVHHWKV